MTRTITKVVAVLTLLLLGAGRLAPIYPLLDIANLFTVPLAMLLVSAIAALALPKRGLGAGLVLLVVMVIGHGLLPRASALLAGPRVTNSGKLLRVGTISTLGANHDLAALEKQIRRLDPDIMVLLEMWPDKAALLDSLKEQYPYRYDCMAESNCQLALISKYKFASVTHEGPNIAAGLPRIRASFGPELQGLTFIGVHLQRIPRIDIQLQQSGVLAEELQTIRGPLVLAGDFNATPATSLLAKLEDLGRLQRLTWLPSWPATFGLPQFAIDHVFVGGGITPFGGPIMGQYAGSDHLAVVVEPQLPPR